MREKFVYVESIFIPIKSYLLRDKICPFDDVWNKGKRWFSNFSGRIAKCFFFLIRSLYLILRSWKQANIKEEFNFWNRLTLYQNLCFKKRQEKCEFRNTSRRNGLSPITGGFQPDFDRENNVSKSVKNKIFQKVLFVQYWPLWGE